MEKFFKLKENGTTVRTEILAGLTTFMTMAYIIALNPNLLTGFGANGQDLWNAVFMATCIASAIGIFCMAFLANKPFAMAPGMGLNSFFAVVVANIAGLTGMTYVESFQSALVIILIEGIIFFILSILNIREKIVEAIPLGVRYGIAPAIGLMLMNIGLGSNVGVYAAGNDFTTPFFMMRDFFGALTPSVIRDYMGAEGYTQMVLTVATAFIGLFVIILLAKKGVKAAVLLGMLVASVIYWAGEAIFMGVNPFASLSGASFVPPFADMMNLTFFKFDFAGFFQLGWFTAITLILTFCMIDMFDTIGTLVGTASRAGMVNEKGEMPNMKEALLSDAVGTVVGACTGTSTVTTFIESASGVEAGGRTGRRPDHRHPVPCLHLHCPHCRHYPRRSHLCRADLCGHPDASGSEERGLRRHGSNGSRGADADRYAHLRLHRPRHRPWHDLLHRHQAVLRQGQGGQRADLCHLHPVPHQVLRGGVTSGYKALSSVHKAETSPYGKPYGEVLHICFAGRQTAERGRTNGNHFCSGVSAVLQTGIERHIPLLSYTRL